MKLKPCPNSPNCVSSQSEDTAHYIEPISYSGAASDALLRMKQIINSLPRSRLLDENPQWLHFEIKTWLMHFVDDVEIIVDDIEKILHIRSASRLGYSDLGVNRRRVELIRKKFSTP